MTENPYDILGISPDASPEEVKRAYRKKARENHPDLNPDDPSAEERMNKVNEAYDRIINPEKYVASDARRAGYGAPYTPGYPSGYGSPYTPGGQGAGPFVWTVVDFEDIFNGGWGSSARTIHPEVAASDSSAIRQAISLINAGAYSEAVTALDNISAHDRTARWNYLFALANHGAGNIIAAQQAIRRARHMDPTNADYARAETMFAEQAHTYTQQGQKRGFTSRGIDPNWICCCICLGPSCCSYLSRLLWASGGWF